MEILELIKESPTAFQAVGKMAELLNQEEAERLYEEDVWNLERGKMYYVIRNESALIAFSVPEDPECFRVFAAHADSPCFKIKENPEIRVEDAYVKLNVEGYGGMIQYSWFDRPLSVAGRVVVLREGRPESIPVNIDRDLFVIPSLAIHMNRAVNDGVKLNIQKDLLPLYGGADTEGTFWSMIAENAGVSEEDILGHDLYLYVRQPGFRFGKNGEFICAPRIDDLECAYAGLQGFIAGTKKEAVCVMTVFDNEEVGSCTRQGAESTFLLDTLKRISAAVSLSETDYLRMVSKSFMLSADNGHSVHPNYPELCDPTNRPRMNGGILLKYSANQRYTTDAYSAAFVKALCQKQGVPYQVFHNRSDIKGGGTLGNISTTQVPFPTADIGLCQLAMHSACEEAGALDYEYMKKLSEGLFA